MSSRKFRRGRLVAVALSVIVLAAFTLAHLGRKVPQRIGFYSPGGIPGEVVRNTEIGVFNAVSPQQVDANLRQLGQADFGATIDLGQVITRVASPDKVGMRYGAAGRKLREKTLTPKIDGNVREFLPDRELIAKLGPLLDVMATHPAHVDAVFLADEPYLNGISKAELERVGAIVRRELNARDLRKVKIGVIFASAMFDRDFARMLDTEAGAYVRAIDARLGGPSTQPGFQEWAATIRKHRLATYDRAGNMYVDGGLPRGFDVIGFDFYLSTLLLDGVHEHSLSWLADRYPVDACKPFIGRRISEIRKSLSFFQPGPVVQAESARAKDRELLDGVYRCRMEATTKMLKRAAGGRRLDFLLVSESSSNGVLEFDPEGSPEHGQPPLLVESRVLDEVMRAQEFYLAHRCFYSGGLLYFTFADAYDSTIKLNVGGVASMPSVKASIFRFAGETGKWPVACGLHDYWSKVVDAVSPGNGIRGGG